MNAMTSKSKIDRPDVDAARDIRRSVFSPAHRNFDMDKVMNISNSYLRSNTPATARSIWHSAILSIFLLYFSLWILDSDLIFPLIPLIVSFTGLPQELILTVSITTFQFSFSTCFASLYIFLTSSSLLYLLLSNHFLTIVFNQLQIPFHIISSLREQTHQC